MSGETTSTPGARPTLFADGLLDASVHHGVARLTLGQVGPDGKPVACGQLMVPLPQLPAIANGLLTLLRQIEAKAREAAQQQSAAAGAAPPSVAAAAQPDAGGAMPGTFTFGGR